MDKETIRKILELHQRGLGRYRISRELGISEYVVRYWLDKAKAQEAAKDVISQEPEEKDYPRALREIAEIDLGGEQKIRFAALADTHIGSKKAKISELLQFLERAKKWGAEFYLHAGDLVDGTQMYHGQEYEQDHHGVEEQLRVFLDVWAEWAKPMYFITGNHDLSFWKRAGYDVGKAIALANDQFIYLGAIQGIIKIEGVKIMLWHGSGAGAYALSYKLQRFIESFIPGGKPRILIAGHWHQAAHIFYRNVDAFHAGCFQGMTKYIMAKGLQPTVGGWLIELWVKRGEVKGINTAFVPFYMKDEVSIDDNGRAKA